jgi:hypothetical protein
MWNRREGTPMLPSELNCPLFFCQVASIFNPTTVPTFFPVPLKLRQLRVFSCFRHLLHFRLETSFKQFIFSFPKNFTQIFRFILSLSNVELGLMLFLKLLNTVRTRTVSSHALRCMVILRNRYFRYTDSRQLVNKLSASY